MMKTNETDYEYAIKSMNKIKNYWKKLSKEEEILEKKNDI